MEYVGIAVSTDFSIVILPALERKREVQLLAFRLIMSSIEVNMSLFSLPKCSDNLKYFPTPQSKNESKITKFHHYKLLTANDIFRDSSHDKILDKFLLFLI